MNCIEVQKNDASEIRWLHDGTSKAGRPALEGLNVENGITVTANGFELRIAPTPESLKEFDGKLVRLDKAPRAGGDVVKVDLITDGTFPDWRGVIPTSEPVLKIGINAGWLAALLSGMGKIVELTFYGPTQPIVIKSEDKYALLMPAHIDDRVDQFDPIKTSPQLKESK